MVDENKVRVYAPIQVQEEVEKAAAEKAAFLSFPEGKQEDLSYIYSILVSAGTNKNGAHFLPSEMMKAHNTVVNKAIDLEHEEDKVIGHIYGCDFLFKDGSTFDPMKIMAEHEESASNPDALDIDIGIAGVIHKMRFPELSDEISAGKWKVSMECYFKDFDLKVGDQIITRDEATALGYSPDDLIGGFVKIMAGNKALGKHFVSRVLRNITFSGMGIVENPANPHSIIMETAATRELLEKGEQVINLENIDNLRGHKIEVSSQKEEPTSELAEVKIASEGEEVETEGQIYVELDNDTGGIKRVLTVGGREDATIRWNGPGIGGPGSVSSYPDGICKSFKKRVTKFNALDQSEAQVVHEHWCALFEEACPVIGATAKAPECLRNQKNRTTREESDNTLTKTVREHIDQGPGNTFVTNPTHTVAGAVNLREDQITRIRTDAEDLRNSLRSFVSAEKKTLK